MNSSRDAQRTLLEERARALAKPVQLPQGEELRHPLLLFARGSGRYAIDTRFVIQVVPVQGFAQLPFARSPCLGLAVARGELLGLFELPALTGDALPDEAPPKTMLLCGGATLEFALAVDQALELLEPAPLEPARDDQGLVAGVDPRGFVVIDGAALLSDPRLNLEPEKQETAP